MRAHWAYLKYVVRHKWFVFVAGRRVKSPLWRLIIHDWSKFLPCEWFPYVAQFYGRKPTEDEERITYNLGISIKTRAEIKADFNAAWNHHQKSNKHHWQYWILINDSDEPKIRPQPMPVSYVREMVADWMGAGRAITGKWDVQTWYTDNRDKIILHDHTRRLVEHILTP